ncbi:MAG TPA: hypothetical protein VL172_05890, partial [Kofleriaceae bacterium]|nr:hypothetical protein [Kofleriaceae bacterium]
MRRWIMVVLVAACGHRGGGGDPESAPETDADATTVKTVAGPVIAEVSLSPRQPRLGDPLTLVLRVDAEPGVTVEMPDFGEALGRFSIVKFVPSTVRRADGGTTAEQRYVLQAPMSGRQRIPQLRVEFVDERHPDADAGTEVRELLTDEIPIQIASVLAGDEPAPQLGAPPAALAPPQRQPLWVKLWPVYLAAALALVAVWLLVRGRRRARRQRRVDAWAWARQRLAALEAAGMPSPEQADAWWVELSSVVRAYVEQRFGIRAPELTTEEFLREAGRSAGLARPHR